MSSSSNPFQSPLLGNEEKGSGALTPADEQRLLDKFAPLFPLYQETTSTKSFNLEPSAEFKSDELTKINAAYARICQLNLSESEIWAEIDEFEAANPGCKIELSIHTTTQDQDRSLKLEIAVVHQRIIAIATQYGLAEKWQAAYDKAIASNSKAPIDSFVLTLALNAGVRLALPTPSNLGFLSSCLYSYFTNNRAKMKTTLYDRLAPIHSSFFTTLRDAQPNPNGPAELKEVVVQRDPSPEDKELSDFLDYAVDTLLGLESNQAPSNTPSP